MPQASQESINKSNLLNNYNIISGSLTNQELAIHLKQLGLEKVNTFENNRVSFVLTLIAQPNQLTMSFHFFINLLSTYCYRQDSILSLNQEQD